MKIDEGLDHAAVVTLIMAAYDLGADARSRSIDVKDSLISGFRKELEDLRADSVRSLKLREDEFERQGTLIAKLELANSAKDSAEAEVDALRRGVANLQGRLETHRYALGAPNWDMIDEAIKRLQEAAKLGELVLAMSCGHGLRKDIHGYVGTLHGDVEFTSKDPAIALLNAGVQIESEPQEKAEG